MTYFLLNAEDYRWAWTSFLASASTAVYVFAYATYYFFFKTKMHLPLPIAAVLLCYLNLVLCARCSKLDEMEIADHHTARNPCRYGFMQTMFYFGQTAVMCAALAIVCGSVGYLGARAFVHRIFSGVKSD